MTVHEKAIGRIIGKGNFSLLRLLFFVPTNLFVYGGGVRKIMICVAFFSKFCQISTFYSNLYLILRFTKEAEARKQALPFVPARYIRTFVGISEVDCVLPRRR